jgi:uncharacterized phage-associated protein
MKLQRLLYYAQAWHLGEFGEPLFDDTIQAWMTGPVVPSIFWRFAESGISDIPVQGELPVLLPETKAYLDELASDYLASDEWELEDMSRNEPPWLNARWGAELDPPCYQDVSEEDMRTYFQRLRNAA